MLFLFLLINVKMPTAADDIHKYDVDVSSESSARQRVYMKNQASFSSKDKNKKIKCRLLQFLFASLRVKEWSRLCMLGKI